MRLLNEILQGADGKFSSRKFSTVFSLLMLVVTWFCDLFFDLNVSELMLIIIGITVMIGMGYMTAQNIVDLLKRPQSSYYTDDIYTIGRKAEDEVEG